MMYRSVKTHLLLTATLLITLSGSSLAFDCTEQDWAATLSRQKKINDEYNIMVKRHNEWLPVVSQAIFLHREFSLAELDFLWTHNREFRQTLPVQLDYARESNDQVTLWLHKVEQTIPHIRHLKSAWTNMSQICQEKNLMVNRVSAQHYVEENQKLLNNSHRIRAQFKAMQQRFSNEVLILEKITATPPAQQ